MENLIENILTAARKAAQAREQLIHAEQELSAQLDHTRDGDMFALQSTLRELSRGIQQHLRRTR